MTAKPIICAQQPAVAAPAAKPPIPMDMQSAAELIGSVRRQPTETETKTPIIKGLSMVARLITSPNDITHSLIGTQQYLANKPPTTTATRGVTMISIGVRFDMSEPASIPTMEARYAPIGPPNWYPSAPTATADIVTNGTRLSPKAMDIPMEPPTIGADCSKVAISLRKSSPGIKAICLIIRPKISEQKRPIAIKLRASTIYVLKSLLTVDCCFFFFIEWYFGSNQLNHYKDKH